MADREHPESFGGLVGFLRNLVSSGKSKSSNAARANAQEQEKPYSVDDDPNAANPCCDGDGTVHIAYRGVSDDRLYIVYGKQWRDTRFFRPHGLRVFCARCRRRIV